VVYLGLQWSAGLHGSHLVSWVSAGLQSSGVSAGTLIPLDGCSEWPGPQWSHLVSWVSAGLLGLQGSRCLATNLGLFVAVYLWPDLWKWTVSHVLKCTYFTETYFHNATCNPNQTWVLDGGGITSAMLWKFLGLQYMELWNGVNGICDCGEFLRNSTITKACIQNEVSFSYLCRWHELKVSTCMEEWQDIRNGTVLCIFVILILNAFNLESIAATDFNFVVMILTSSFSTPRNFVPHSLPVWVEQACRLIMFKNCRFMPYFGGSPFDIVGLC